MLRNRVIEVERANSENMSGVISADLSCDQGDCVEIEGSSIAVESLDELGDQVRNTMEVTIQAQSEVSLHSTPPLYRVIYKTYLPA